MESGKADTVVVQALVKEQSTLSMMATPGKAIITIYLIVTLVAPMGPKV